MPSQVSAVSHSPVMARHTEPEDTGAQVPSVPPVMDALHAWQSFALLLPQALSQHTPSAQNPLAHSLPELQVVPRASATSSLPLPPPCQVWVEPPSSLQKAVNSYLPVRTNGMVTPYTSLLPTSEL